MQIIIQEERENLRFFVLLLIVKIKGRDKGRVVLVNMNNLKLSLQLEADNRSRAHISAILIWFPCKTNMQLDG